MHRLIVHIPIHIQGWDVSDVSGEIESQEKVREVIKVGIRAYELISSLLIYVQKLSPSHCTQ
jgi:hypothetical protein